MEQKKQAGDDGGADSEAQVDGLELGRWTSRNEKNDQNSAACYMFQEIRQSNRNDRKAPSVGYLG